MKPSGLSACLRQVHLDFHTSPFIPDVGSEFDAKAFVRTVKQAQVNSMTVFAKCHHGMCYYPTKSGTQHPALKGRDLLGEQIEALHREGIGCPIYTTVVWEEDVAEKHPEWRQMDKEGRFLDTAAVVGDPQPGRWKFNNFLHPDYQDYIEVHLRELFSRYEVDGIFFDIVFFNNRACWSEASMDFRKKHGFLKDDPQTFERFQGAAQKAFGQRFHRLVKGLGPKASVFFNAGNEANIDVSVGPRAREKTMTHFEIESLPSGFWGYQHFPRMARMQSHWGKPWLGMTGRFQKMWGDFGGVKPQAALEYECFRSQALGGGNSVGDQLPPRGIPDQAAYDLIGAVYSQVKEAEPFYEDSKPLAQVAIFSASYPGKDGGVSEEGAVQICEESHYDSAVCDPLSSLTGIEVVVLPDSTIVTPDLKTKLAAFYKKGGKLILSYRSGFDADGNWALDFLPLSFAGAVEKYPTYWRVRANISKDLSRSDRVFYRQGMNVKGGKGTRVWVDRVLPYFKRSDLQFSSHFQTPPVSQVDPHPSVIGGERFVYFADPVFQDYRQSGNLAARDVIKLALRHLVGEAPFGEGLPTTVQVYPRQKGKDLLLTLLHYVPVRKSMEIDIIEERHSFHGEILKLAGKVKEARIWGGAPLEKAGDGSFLLPGSKGRLLVEVPDYFPRGK